RPCEVRRSRSVRRPVRPARGGARHGNVEVMASLSDRVVGIGEVCLHQIGVAPRSRESVIELTRFSAQAGGAIGTALATVCAFGAQARYFGRLSDDEFAALILKGLRDFGVETSFVLTEPDKTSPVSFTLVDEITSRRVV